MSKRSCHHEIETGDTEEPVEGYCDPIVAARESLPTTIHGRFEAIAAATPNAVAIVDGCSALNYAQLDLRANFLAREIVQAGAKPGDLVGLHTDNGTDTVCGILAILKAGCGYLPLDPIYPVDRLQYMLEDAQIQILVTQDHMLGTLSAPVLKVIRPGFAPRPADEPQMPSCDADSLAYVIYTSGSTGKPKGVEITHGNVTRLFDQTDHWFGFGPDDSWTLFHSYAFDFSVWEIWGALLHGGRLVVVPHLIRRSPADFRDLLISEGVTILNQTPSAFRQLVAADAVCEPGRFALRRVVFGGEALDFESLRPWLDRYGDRFPQLVNMYGITETTVHVTYRPISSNDLDNSKGSMIGEVIPDLRLHILDDKMNPVAVGEAGEIFVAGPGLSRGYLNRPELTAERFVTVSLSPASNQRLYRTGDLARQLPDGDIEYLGRKDQQVKISGYRIELGEIEAAMMAEPDVTEAVAIARDDLPAGRAIVAYLSLRKDSRGKVEHLRNALRRNLPEYMVPSHFCVVDQFPLTENGKLDRAKLPLPDAARTEVTFNGSATDLERLIVSIWCEKLGLGKIGVEESFFDLGGKSLQLIQVYSELSARLSRRFPITAMFDNPTVQSLASYLDRPDPEPEEVHVEFDQLHALAGRRAQMQRSASARRRAMRGD